jgi:hypothetical protein
MKRVTGGLVALLLAAGGLVAGTAGTASAQTVAHTFVAVQCDATVNGTHITQAQDVAVEITAPDVATPNAPFTITFPGGSAVLPSSSSGFTVTSYSNLSLTYQIAGTVFTPGSIVNPGTATLVPTAPPNTPQTITETATLTAPDKITTGNPDFFVPGTLTTPDISVSAVAPASGNITLNAFQLTTNVVLNGRFPTSVVCAIPTDTIITIPTAPPNTPPTVSAGPDGSGNIGDAIPVSGTVTDPDSTPTQQWTADTPFCSFADPSQLSTTISCTKAGVFNATLTADDGSNPPVGDSAQVTILTPNVAPTVNAGPDVTGQVSDDIELSGTVTDPDSTPTTSWTVNSPDCTFDDATNPDAFINCTTPGTFTATLTADDGVNAPVSDTAQVTINPIPPGLTVLAGPDASGNVGTPITVKGKVTDPGHTPTSLWTIDGPGCTFANAALPTTTVTCTGAGVFAATLTGQDGVNPVGTDTALVTVIQPNVPPTVNAGPDVSGASTHAIALHGVVTDPDSTPIVSWTTDSPGCSFANPSVADTTITCTTGGVFAATLTAADGVNPPVSDTALVTVQVNVSPEVNAGPDVSGNAGTLIALSGSVDDPDSTPTVSWSTANPNCSFADPTSAVTTIQCTVGGVMAATLTANDGINPPVSDTALVTVVQPNVPPTVNAGPDLSGTINHSLLLAASVTDPDNTPSVHWSTGSPSCTFANPNVIVTSITCSAPGIFAATLTAADGVNPPASDSAIVQYTPKVCSGTCLSIGDSTTYEGGVIALPITLNVPSGAATTFTATVTSDNATNGSDFKTPVKHTIKIAAGKVEAFLSVTTLKDAVSDPTETFHVDLSAITPGVSAGRTRGFATILDDTGMAPGVLLFGSSSIVELDSSCTACKGNVKVPVVLSGAVASNVTVKWITADAGATAGSDYLAKKVLQTLTFKTGTALQKLLLITTFGDANPEPTEGINLVFSSPVNAVFANAGTANTGHIDILDND